MFIEKIYYIENSVTLENALLLLQMPHFCLSVTREYVEMDYSKITVICLENQILGVESILAECM